MISDNDVISQQSLILSVDDVRIGDLKYNVGDKFTATDLDFYADLVDILENRQVIVEIKGYALTHDGAIVYNMSVIEPDDEQFDFSWLLSDKDLEESFFFIGTSTRFVMIDA